MVGHVLVMTRASRANAEKPRQTQKLSPSVPSSFFNTCDHIDEHKTVSTFVSIESGQDTVDGDAQPKREKNDCSALYFSRAKPWVETHWGIVNMN
jgi:hypothetical protein